MTTAQAEVVAIFGEARPGDISREISRAIVAYNDGARALQAAEHRTESLREQQAQRRLELGRLLIEAKRGVKHGEWLPYLERLGIADRTAREWMTEAGYVDGVILAAKSDAADMPRRVAAGIDKRPRKRDEEPDPPQRDASREVDRPADDDPKIHTSWQRDLSKALVGIDKMIMGYAKSWPKRSRSDLAKALRSVADRIERMAGE